MATARVDIDLDGLPRIQEVVDRAVASVEPPNITEAVVEAAGVFRDGARRRAPRRSGRLAASIEVERLGTHSAAARTDLVYAQIHEFGGTIRPVNGRYLKFNGSGGPKFLRALRIQPSPYWLPTYEQDSPRAVEAAGEVIDRHIGD